MLLGKDDMVRRKNELYSNMMTLASMHCDYVTGTVGLTWSAWESLARKVEAIHDRLFDEIGPDDPFWDELLSKSDGASFVA